MKKLFLPLLCLLLADIAKATVYYWQPEGAATPTGANLVGTWDASTLNWSTTSAQSATPVAFNSVAAACFSAGSTTVTTPFVVTLNSTITIGGIFNGSLAPPGCFVTVSGSGLFVLAAGADAFSTGGSDGGTTTVAVPMTGSGQVALEASGQIYFNAANTYSGGTIFGYPGVASFSGIVNINNGNAFGSGTIQMSSVGSGAIVVEGTSPITIPNAFLATNANLNIVGNAAGLTFSGPWSLPATPNIGSGGSAGNLVTISGVMSGAGGINKFNPGILVFSGANSYSGGTTISNGILSVTADNNLGTAPGTASVNLTLSGGTLNASNTFTLKSNRLVSLTANSTISVSSGKTLTYAGSISGGFGLTKSSTGTLALGGVNIYTGATTISGGTLEADAHSGSSTGTNNMALQAAGTLSGSGIVSGAVAGNGSIAPGTAAGAATLTFGNGLDLSSGGTYVWNLTSNTMSTSPMVSIIGGNLKLGGSSKLSLSFSGNASAPSTNNAFWQTQEAWTILSVSGSGSNSNLTKFASLLNGNYAAGNFTHSVSGNGNLSLLYQPNFAVFDALYDAGPGFVSGENLIFTNISGLALYAWSSANGNLAVSNWTLIGQMQEQPLAPALPGYSRYSINVSPTISPTYVVAGNKNTGPYIYSPVPATTLTTSDFSTFDVESTNTVISSKGVIFLVPVPPIIVPGSYTSGGFQFQFGAATNQNYTIQASTDLTTWANISSGTVSNSPVIFTDTAATNYGDRFYRVSLP